MYLFNHPVFKQTANLKRISNKTSDSLLSSSKYVRSPTVTTMLSNYSQFIFASHTNEYIVLVHPVSLMTVCFHSRLFTDGRLF